MFKKSNFVLVVFSFLLVVTFSKSLFSSSNNFSRNCAEIFEFQLDLPENFSEIQSELLSQRVIEAIKLTSELNSKTHSTRERIVLAEIETWSRDASDWLSANTKYFFTKDPIRNELTHFRPNNISKIDEILSSPLATYLPNEAFEPTEFSLPKNMRAVWLKFTKSSIYSEIIREQPEIKDNLRSQLIEMMNLNDMRTILVEAARKDLNEMQRKVPKAGSMDDPYDILFIGAGLHEQTMQNYLRENRFALRTLTIEREEVVGSTFAFGGKAFNLNSSSKAEDSSFLRQKLGEADLNFLPGGVIQVNQFGREKNPPAEYFADAITINRALSPNPVFFGREVTNVNVVFDGSERLYQVILNTGEKIRTRSVVQTGIGQAVVPDKIQNLFRYYNAQTNSMLKPIMTYPEFMKFVNSTRNPLTPFSKKRVAVIGPGDSGKAIIRWLSIQSNPDSYGRDTRRVAAPKALYWYGQTCNTCAEFIDENRSFYADLVGGFKSGKIIPKDKLAEVYRNVDGSFTLRTVTDFNTPRSTFETVDYIIVTAGFKNNLEKIYETILSGIRPLNVETSSNFRKIRGYEPTLGEVTFGRQLVDSKGFQEDIYFVGPIAGKIVNSDELKDIEENFVANANHNWRVWRSIEALSIKLLADLEFQNEDINKQKSAEIEPKDKARKLSSEERSNRIKSRSFFMRTGRRLNDPKSQPRNNKRGDGGFGLNKIKS